MCCPLRCALPARSPGRPRDGDKRGRPPRGSRDAAGLWGDSAPQQRLRGGRASTVIQQAPAGEGGGVGSLCRTWPSTQAGWEVDVGGVRAPRAVNPCRLGQQPPPCPWPRWGSVAAEVYRGSVTPTGVRGGCWQAADAHACWMAGHRKASLVTSYLHQRIQLLIENREFFSVRLFSVALYCMQIVGQQESCLPNILCNLPHQRIWACPLDLQIYAVSPFRNRLDSCVERG